MNPIFRASMNRVSPCLSQFSLRLRPFDRNHRQAGIWVDRNNCPGRAMMQSTRSASTMFFRISPSPDWLEDMDPFASTNPAMPRGARWWRKCCTQAKLAFPTGGIPWTHLLSSLSWSPFHSEMLNGGFARM